MKHLTNKHRLEWFESQFQFVISTTIPRGMSEHGFHYKVSFIFKAWDFRMMFLSLLIGGVDIRYTK